MDSRELPYYALLHFRQVSAEKLAECHNKKFLQSLFQFGSYHRPVFMQKEIISDK